MITHTLQCISDITVLKSRFVHVRSSVLHKMCMCMSCFLLMFFQRSMFCVIIIIFLLSADGKYTVPNLSKMLSA